MTGNMGVGCCDCGGSSPTCAGCAIPTTLREVWTNGLPFHPCSVDVRLNYSTKTLHLYVDAFGTVYDVNATGFWVSEPWCLWQTDIPFARYRRMRTYLWCEAGVLYRAVAVAGGTVTTDAGGSCSVCGPTDSNITEDATTYNVGGSFTPPIRNTVAILSCGPFHAVDGMVDITAP